MKKFLILSALVLAVYVYGAPPTPPVFNGVVGMPNSGAWVTNTAWVYTNVCIKTPTVTFPQVTIYHGTNGLTDCTILYWDPSPDALTGYKVYYNDVGGGSPTNTLPVLPSVTSVVFFGIFNTNTMYWCYVTALNGPDESGPSNVVLFRGK